MKKFLSLLFSCIVVLSLASITFATEGLLIAPNPMAEQPILVQNDGGYVEFADENGLVVEPQIINGRTMVPFRKIFNSLGVTNENIEWVAEERKVIAKSDDVTIELQIDNKLAKKIVGEEVTEIALDSAPTIIDGRTMVPVRFIAESMNKNVGWDASNRTVIIIDSAKIVEKVKEAMPKYFEIIEAQKQPLNTFEMPTDFALTLDYSDSEDKSNNTKLNVTGDINVARSETAILLDLDLTVTGSGILYETIKDEDLNKISFSLILTEEAMYIKTSLLDSEAEVSGKWIKYVDESIKPMFNMMSKSYNDPMLAIEEAFNEYTLDVNTYSEIESVIEILADIYSVMDVSVSSTKYEIKLDLLDLIELLKKYDKDMYEDAKLIKQFVKTATVKTTGTIKNALIQSAKNEVVLNVVEDTEKLNLKFNANSKITSYNKPVEIKMPAQKEIYDISNM